MVRLKSPLVGVGVDSITLDIIINFQNLEDMKDLINKYDGELLHHLTTAHKSLSNDKGGEVSIDGKGEEAEKILSIAQELGAEISTRLGGNAGQKTIALNNLGVSTILLTGIPYEVLSQTEKKKRILENINTEFALDLNRLKPASYVLQAVNTERYILANAKGRRIEQLKEYLLDLPETVESISEKFGELNALTLVGWHVLFGNRFSDDDLKLIVNIIEKLKEKTDALLFTDAGGFEDFDREGKEKLFQIYSLFDIISINEIEASQIAIKCNYETDHHFKDLNCVYEALDNISTVWMHTKTYQASISDSFSKNTLEKAQDFAALAGLYWVEKGEHPTLQEIEDLKKKRSFSEKGVKTVKKMKENYSDLVEAEFAVTPCYESENFVSTVGSGDVSGAGYLYSILKSV